MAIQKTDIEQFLQLAAKFPVLDARSPGEFKHAYFPGAYSLPLFSDEERKVVGTAYKQQSKRIAIKIGLKFFGAKMVKMVEEAESIAEKHPARGLREVAEEKTVLVHCWRGGMRSAAVAWLLDMYGFKVYSLSGGYKSFRQWCGAQFNKEYSFAILGGNTGSGKTETLKELLRRGRTVIDIEALASHKGSAFGNLGAAAQPSQEMFENLLALALADAGEKDITWIEDESRRIGSVSIPDALFASLQTKPLFFLDVPFNKRLDYLVKSYGQYKKEDLAERIGRIKKRLGGLETKEAVELLEAGNIHECFAILLKYYDKYYLKCLEQKKDQLAFYNKIVSENTDAATNADLLIKQGEITVEK